MVNAVQSQANEPRQSGAAAAPAEDRRRLSPAAERALAEAAARRAEPRSAELGQPPEVDGRDGPEPVRYGDWEVGGRAVDF